MMVIRICHNNTRLVSFGIAFVSFLLLCHILSGSFTGISERSTRSRIKYREESKGKDVSVVSPNRASYNYRQDTSVPFRWEEPLQGAAFLSFRNFPGSYSTITLGFDFHFYDGVYPGINVFRWGYASFTSTYDTDSNQRFPTSDSRYQKIISPLWEWIYYWSAGQQAGIYHKRLQNPDRYLITWYQAPYGSGTSTCQVVLYKDSGNILFNYQSVSASVRPTVGLNDGDGTHFNMPYYSNQRPSASQSIVFGIVDNDVAMDMVVTPEPNAHVLPGNEIYVNATVINYGFNTRNNVPVELSIACDEDGGYHHTNSTASSGNLGIMDSTAVSFQWSVPNHENRHYTVTLRTTLANPPDEVADGNELTFRLIGKTYLDAGVWEVPRLKGEWYPYQEIPVNVRVANWGNIDTNFSVKMTINGAYWGTMVSPLVRSGGIEGVFEEHIINITFHWIVKNPGNYNLGFTTILNGDEDNSNNAGSVRKDVVVSPYDVRLGFNGSTLNGKPNSAVSFKVTVYNDGKKKDDIQMNVTEYPEEQGWSKPLFDHNVLRSMSRESSREISVIVAIPPKAIAGLATIRIRGLSLSDGNSNASLGLLVNVLPDPNLMIEAPTPQSAYPGAKVVYNFTIRNTGNSVDSFSIVTSTTTSWDTRILGSSMTPELTPYSVDDNFTIQVETTVPETALHGSTDILKVTAASLEDITVQSSAHVDTTVLQLHDVKIRSSVSEYSVHTENDLWISFNVTNTGNGKDDTIFFNVSTPVGWYTYVDDSKLHGGLERLYWSQIFMKVRVPRGTPNDKFPIEVTVMSGGEPEPKDTHIFYFNILPEYGVNISSPEPQMRSLGKDSVIYKLDIRNVGNTNEEFTVSSPSEWVTFRNQGMDLSDLWLGANETASVEAFVTIPPGIGADSDNSTKEIDSYRFTIEVFSSTNPKTIHDSAAIFLAIDTDYDHVLYTPAPSLKAARKSDEQVINKLIYLENTGNVQDIIHLTMPKSEDGPVSATIRTINVLLAFGETKAIVLTIRIRKDAPRGTYDLLIRSASGGNGSEIKKLSLIVEIVDYDFHVSYISVDGIEVLPGSTSTLTRNVPVTIRAGIENIGLDGFEGKNGNNLTVTFYLGGMELYSLELNEINLSEKKELTFQWSPKVVGELELMVRANPENAIPELIVNNNIKTVTINVVSDDYGGKVEPEKEATSKLVFYGGIALIALLICSFITLLFVLRKGRLKEGYDKDGAYRPDMGRSQEEGKEITIDLDEWDDIDFDYDDETGDGSPKYMLGKRKAPSLTGGAARSPQFDGQWASPQLIREQPAQYEGTPRLPSGTTLEIRSLPPGSGEWEVGGAVEGEITRSEALPNVPVTPPPPTTGVKEESAGSPVIVKRITTTPMVTKNADRAPLVTVPVNPITTKPLPVIITTTPLRVVTKPLPAPEERAVETKPITTQQTFPVPPVAAVPVAPTAPGEERR